MACRGAQLHGGRHLRPAPQFSAQAVPYLRKLRDRTRETANLAVVDDEAIVVLTRMEAARSCAR
jgi:DNA-binding IclR family transcriptional regulator